MRTFPDRESLFQEAMARMGDLGPNEGPDVLLQHFISVLNGMELQTARTMRNELMNRFGGRYCSQQICQMMVDLLNGYLEPTQSRPRE